MMAARLLASARVAAPRLTVLLPPCRAGAAMTLRLARPQTALASVLAATGAAVSQQPTAVPRHRAMSTSSSRDAGNATAVVDDVETASSLIRNVVGSEKVVVFSALYCPFCSGAKDIFSERNVPFTVFELDKGPVHQD
ncbi:hypothetical protein PTSG_01164 [Salpingoeca rosetta]|uniref:Glutaredoxin domain-containing protein n=1 Tax=Salpingoeca rosetta (strain ATCC 50818 / BSB-021) TaxID=946362 RepID=F2U0Z8_SALR5|nr:uncharacterized protein PTSG_01164 [Salpingoeca rosetta]EGD80572.1 hypothetical protein PTSG_01164 [Salpingoeca rosetta]|eukprot:XP_004997133.1 hypothetical protein PTSG_01164 [Salpingoeca rosetta]